MYIFSRMKKDFLKMKPKAEIVKEKTDFANKILIHLYPSKQKHKEENDKNISNIYMAD